MSDTATKSDMGLGLGLFFGVLAIVGAGSMFLTHGNQILAGWSFALAMLAGGLAVTAMHAYGSNVKD